jgi:hypothetical protein
MSELLVRVVSKTSDDPRLDAKLTKAGDVIVVAEDGHEWGRMEGPPDYRIVRVPGVPAVEFASLIARQPPLADAIDHADMTQARAFWLDLPGLRDVMTRDEVMSLRMRRGYLQDPDVLG